MRELRLTPQEIEGRRQTGLALNLAQHLRTGYHGPRWTWAQLRLLGKARDDAVVAKVGRTPNAMRLMRGRLGIANPGR
jgi:hypothetical protein